MLFVRAPLALVALVALAQLLMDAGALWALPTALLCWAAWSAFFVGPAYLRWVSDGRSGRRAGREPRPDEGHGADAGSVSAVRAARLAGGPGGAAREGWGFEVDDD